MLESLELLLVSFFFSDCFLNCFLIFFSTACFSALRSILVVDLMGLDRLTNAFGILMLFQGLAAAMGAPIAGKFLS